jgi:hypothetical protein
MRATTPICACLLAALSACSTTEALDPAALGATHGANGAAQSAVAGAAQGSTSGAPATVGLFGGAAAALLPTPAATGPAIAAGTRMQFAPVVGASVNAAGPLSRRLSQRAAERGLEIVAKVAGPTDFLVKGYMSAIGEGKETVVIYVWDIIGADGNRLHRIQGQERTDATAADPWSVVPDQTMEAIADRTIEEIAAWTLARAG